LNCFECLDHSHIIRAPSLELRIGSCVPVRGTFANRFVQIRQKIRREQRTSKLEERTGKKISIVFKGERNVKGERRTAKDMSKEDKRVKKMKGQER